jgi:hypothetical protein
MFYNIRPDPASSKVWGDKKMMHTGSTVVKHSPNLSKVKGSSPFSTPDTGRKSSKPNFFLSLVQLFPAAWADSMGQ